MSAQEFRQSLNDLGIGQTELARWLGVQDRAIRHYVHGTRPVPPALSLMIEYLRDRPEAKAWFVHRARSSK